MYSGDWTPNRSGYLRNQKRVDQFVRLLSLIQINDECLMDIKEFWSVFASFWTICWCLPSEDINGGNGFPCAIRCKDQHMLAMRQVIGDASEWSLDFLMPLQTILRHASNVTSASNSIGFACNINYDYGDCLAHCPRNEASSVLLLGIKPWSYICRWRDKSVFGESVLPCWWSRINEIQSYCGENLKKLTNVINAVGGGNVDSDKTQYFTSLCRSVKSYDACHLTAVRSWCPFAILIQFLMGLNIETNETLIALSQYAAIRTTLPEECMNWNIDQSVNSSRILAPREDRVMGIAIPSNRNNSNYIYPTLVIYILCNILCNIIITEELRFI